MAGVRIHYSCQVAAARAK